MNLDDLDQFDRVHETDDLSIPDGIYTVRVQSVDFGFTKTEKRLLKWQLQIVAGEYAGRVLYRNNLLEPDSVQWLKKDLKSCGLMLERVSDLTHKYKNLEGIELIVSKKKKGEYDNVYINGLARPDARCPVKDPIDDIPF